MTEQHYTEWMTRLHKRAARLSRLAELNAPAKILANETTLVLQALGKVYPEAVDLAVRQVTEGIPEEA